MKPKPEKAKSFYQIIPYRRSSIRETIVWIFFLIILTAAAFGWGLIYENRRNANLRKEFLLQDQKIKQINGRLIAIEGKKKIQGDSPSKGPRGLSPVPGIDGPWEKK